MTLTKDDLKQIDKIVTNRVGKRVTKSEDKILSKIDNRITKTEEKILSVVDEKFINSENKLTKIIDRKVSESENRIISTLSREITDLSEINRAVIERVDKIEELEKRIIRLEEREGIVA